MFYRSLKTKRPMIWRTFCWMLLALAALPRLTVHSHSSLIDSGIQAANYAQHLQLFHADATSDLPPDFLHVHWLLGNGSDVSLCSANQCSIDTAHDDVTNVGHFLSQGLTDNFFSLDTTREVSSAVRLAPTIDLRICFCVWTC